MAAPVIWRSLRKQLWPLWPAWLLANLLGAAMVLLSEDLLGSATGPGLLLSLGSPVAIWIALSAGQWVVLQFWVLPNGPWKFGLAWVFVSAAVAYLIPWPSGFIVVEYSIIAPERPLLAGVVDFVMVGLVGAGIGLAQALVLRWAVNSRMSRTASWALVVWWTLVNALGWGLGFTVAGALAEIVFTGAFSGWLISSFAVVGLGWVAVAGVAWPMVGLAIIGAAEALIGLGLVVMIQRLRSAELLLEPQHDSA